MGEFQGAQVTSELSSEKGGRLSISLFSLGTYATAASQGARGPQAKLARRAQHPCHPQPPGSRAGGGTGELVGRGRTPPGRQQCALSSWESNGGHNWGEAPLTPQELH